MPEVNWIAIVVAAVASFLLGGLWYSPVLFGKAWQRETGLTDEQLKKGNMAKIFGLVAAFCACSPRGFRDLPRATPVARVRLRGAASRRDFSGSRAASASTTCSSARA